MAGIALCILEKFALSHSTPGLTMYLFICKVLADLRRSHFG